ncbi:hypothetical protein BRD18_03575 [Halobacteriales archaeon SW_7_71_33]|nr:MAG: hypothetical protein BRD18_03575 [Halobacteriales archaeon SW_7_71_33]
MTPGEADESSGDADAACEHLAYRTEADGEAFETARAYCTVVERFVRPVRADVCNARYDLAPAEHCEFYREHEGVEDEWLTGDRDDGGRGSGDEADTRES